MNKLPVIATVVNHNAAPALETLLPQLVNAGYDEVAVVDDASTDHSHDVAEQYPEVTFYGAAREQGPSATRNRIAEYHPDAFVHFLDPHATLVSPATDAADRIRAAVPSVPFGFIGGLVYDEQGRQNPWNYGPRQGLSTAIGSNLQSLTSEVMQRHPEVGARMRRNMHTILRQWPDVTEVFPGRGQREVYWAMEQNLVVPTAVLKGVGGFDERLYEHGIQDLAIRLAARGLKRYFDPAIMVRLGKREPSELYHGRSMVQAEAVIARKHGLLKWLGSRD